MRCELVFSRYSEDVGFLRHWPGDATVYNKGEPVVPPRPGDPVVGLPNRGMDTQTIFHHLAERYDTLADVTLFLAGNWAKYRVGFSAGPLANVNPCLEWYAPASYDPLWPVRAHRFVGDNGWPGPVVHYGRWAELLETGEIEKSPYTLGEFWDRTVGGPRPETIHYCPGQTFSVAKRWVHGRPQGWYRAMAEWFGRTFYPEECHHMERLWLYVFRPGGRKDVDL